MRSFLYGRRALAAQTDSFNLMKINDVTSIVRQLKTSKTNKIIKVTTSAPNPGNTQIHSSGTEWFRNKIRR